MKWRKRGEGIPHGVLLFPLALALLALLAVPAHAAFDPETDYMERMFSAALCGDAAAGRAAQACRDEKIAMLGLAAPRVDYDELFLLARLIQSEAGSCWLGEYWKMAVGEVALNRVASPEFPNTLAEVVTQQGQYAPGYRFLLPDGEALQAALRLLEGERVLGNPAVVFQSNSQQGGGVYLELWDEQLGSTYFCLSSHPEYYSG